MKKNLVIIVILSFIFSSCVIQNEYFINNDKSGEFVMTLDLTSFLKQTNIPLNKLAKKMSQNDSLNVLEIDENETFVKDSVIYFEDIFDKYKDSISALTQDEQDIVNKFRTMSFHFHVTNVPDSSTYLQLKAPFKDVNHFMFSPSEIDKIKEIVSKKDSNKVKMPFEMPDVRQTISFDDDVFEVNIAPNELTNSEIDSLRETMSNNMFDSLLIIKNMYHFNKKIKSVSNHDAKISDDRKTVIVNGSFKESIIEPEKGSIQIELEE